MTRTALILTALTVSVACASGGREAEEERISSLETVEYTLPDGRMGAITIAHENQMARADVPVGRAALLAEVAAAFDGVGLGEPQIDPAAGRVVLQERLRARLGGERLSHYFECGRGPGGRFADIYPIDTTVQMTLTVTDTALTAVQVRADGQGVSTGSVEIRCTSLGRLETRLLDALVERLAPV